MCAFWSPAGLAFKLPKVEVEALIAGGAAKPRQYFPQGHIKKGYALCEDPDINHSERWRDYFLRATQQT